MGKHGSRLYWQSVCLCSALMHNGFPRKWNGTNESIISRALHSVEMIVENSVIWGGIWCIFMLFWISILSNSFQYHSKTKKTLMKIFTLTLIIRKLFLALLIFLSKTLKKIYTSTSINLKRSNPSLLWFSSQFPKKKLNSCFFSHFHSVTLLFCAVQFPPLFKRRNFLKSLAALASLFTTHRNSDGSVLKSNLTTTTKTV